jgi:hypothetical protein
LDLKGHEKIIWKLKVNSFLKINKYNMNEAEEVGKKNRRSTKKRRRRYSRGR